MTRKAPFRACGIRARYHSQRGFALLEILVAFAVLALGLGAISAGIAIAMRSDGRTQTMQIASHLAQSRLEAAGIARALVPGYREGRLAKNYRWQETVTAVSIGAKKPQVQGVQANAQVQGGQANQPTVDGGVASYWVEVVVQAADGTAVQLAALKLASEARQ